MPAGGAWGDDMSGFAFDQYDAADMSYRELRIHCSGHDEDCECCFCLELNERESDADG